jgi:hypothetical protein
MIQIILLENGIRVAQIDYPNNHLVFGIVYKDVIEISSEGNKVVVAPYTEFLNEDSQPYLNAQAVITELERSYVETGGGGGSGNWGDIGGDIETQLDLIQKFVDEATARENADDALDSRTTILENNELKILYYTSINTATGTITIPTNATVILDDFPQGLDAVAETIVNGKPSGLSPSTAGGVSVTVSSFDTAGNYTLSGTPSGFPVALLYVLKIKAIDYATSIDLTKVIEAQIIDAASISYVDTQLAAKAPLASPIFTGTVTTPAIAISGLTSTRIPIVGIGGLLGDDAALTFGSGNLNVGTSTTVPLIIGGSAVGDKVSIKATTGNGTLTSTAFELLVGNNGATVPITVLNNGRIGINNTTPNNADSIASELSIGNSSKAGTGVTFFTTTTSTSHLFFADGNSGGALYRGAISYRHLTDDIILRAGWNGSSATGLKLTTSTLVVDHQPATTGATTPFDFTTPASTNQTLSTETIGVRFNMSASIQHATGALTTQRDFVIDARTHTAVGASVITNSATLAITGAPIAGSNTTLTNRYAIWTQNGLNNFGTQAPVNTMSTNGLAIEAVSSSRTLSLYSTNQAISKTFSFDSNTGSDNASINHYGTTYAGNYTGTSLPLLKSFDIQNGGSNSINSVVVRGTPVVNIIGSTSTNAGTRLDATGFRIGTLADVHTANTVGFELGEAMNCKFGTTTGTKIGTSTSQKIGLWNVTPIIQPANANQAAVATTVATTAATNVAPYGYTTQAQADDLITEVGELKVLVNQLRSDLVAFGAIKGSA